MIIIYLSKDGYKLSWENGQPYKGNELFSNVRDAVDYCVDHNLPFQIA